MQSPRTQKEAQCPTARKLKPYFDAHQVEIITDQPLRESARVVVSSYLRFLENRIPPWRSLGGQSDPKVVLEVDVMNRIIFKSVRKQLQQEGGYWAQKLPTVLWFFWMTPNPITEEIPFSLVYGSDALLSVENHLEMARVSHYDELANE
ncbi:hypothetical protein LIER_20846 [Lithospermum erythrorhizon]|uniref:Uncharacterized protein n=1 Tax=Lithospermum erythrorhizon TaxID=34254 RepID=A0AAV3QP28_LITER